VVAAVYSPVRAFVSGMKKCDYFTYSHSFSNPVSIKNREAFVKVD